MKLIRAYSVALLCAILFAPPSDYAQGNQSPADALLEGFHHPPQEAKLRCYWWWLNGHTDEQTITRDLEQMSAKGYGGAILVDADGSDQKGNQRVSHGPLFGSQEWIRLYVHALKEAARLHLEISLNIVSGWNLGGPDVKPEDASKLLTWSRADVHGGHIVRRLATPPARNGFFRDIVVLAYPLRHGDPLPGSEGSRRNSIRALRLKSAARESGFSMPDSTPLLHDAPPVAGEEDARLAEVQDISSYMAADGTLDWKAPAGNWEILRMGYTDSDARVSTASGTWQGLVIDYLDHHAFDTYWTHTVEPLLRAAKSYIGTSLKYLVTDSWELGGTNWTAGFREQFKTLRGYDPVVWLPVVSGRIIEDRDSSTHFLNDLRRTVADLVVTEHYDVFAAHAHAWGLGLHPESGGPHGAPIDALETFRSFDFPQSEFWAESAEHRTRDEDRFFTKEAASAAHIYGKRIVAQEGMTSIGPQWSESLAEDLKPSFDRALTEGMNRLVWHEFTSSPAEAGLPGQEYFAGTHLNPNVTWWAQADGFIEYLNRCQFLLQQGDPVVDLLYFYGNQVPDFVRLKADDPAHVLPGYDYDITNEDALLRTIRIENGTLQSPQGIRYRALAMPVSGRMSLRALRRIEEYVGTGGTVLGPRPSSPTGIGKQEENATFHEIAERVWGSCAAEPHSFGKGRAFCSTDGHKLFETLHVRPDFEHSGNAALDFVHRRDGTADIYFVRNGSSSSVDTMAAFRVTGKNPELWDAVSGNIAAEHLYTEDAHAGITQVPLHLAPYGSLFVIFRQPASLHATQLVRDGNSDSTEPRMNSSEPIVAGHKDRLDLNASRRGTYRLTLSDGRVLRASSESTINEHLLDGDWKVTFESGRGGPDSPITVSKLEDWSRSSDPRIRYFSGSATYEKDFELAAAESRRSVVLSFAHVYQICTVRVNGMEAGTIWAMPYQIDLTGFLHPGKNHLSITVANLWPNRMIGDLQPGARRRYTRTNIRAYTARSPLLPSGLVGPAKLAVFNMTPLGE